MTDESRDAAVNRVMRIVDAYGLASYQAGKGRNPDDGAEERAAVRAAVEQVWLAGYGAGVASADPRIKAELERQRGAQP